MSDYQALKEAFEMAEILADDSKNNFYIEISNTDGSKVYPILFKFNPDEELVEAYVEDDV